MDLRITPLEERIVLDAAGLADPNSMPDGTDVQDAVGEHTGLEEVVVSDSDSGDPSSDDGAADDGDAAAQAAAEALRVLAISDQAAGAEQLASSAMDNILTVVFDGVDSTFESILEQIENALDGQRADSIALATHSRGRSGLAITDSLTATADSIFGDDATRAFWEGMSGLLTDDGRIDLMACDVAGSDLGMDLVDAVEAVTGHSVAASDDATGNGDAADWMLEYGGVNLLETYFAWDEVEAYTGILDGIEVWHVWGGSTQVETGDPIDGLLWDTAFHNVGQALAQAASGDEVWVAAGTYQLTSSWMDADIKPDSDAELSYTVANGVSLYGGFKANAKDLSTHVSDAGVIDADVRDTRDYEANETHLSGDLNGDTSASMGDARHVVTLSSGSLIDGFFIEYGYAGDDDTSTNESFESGGGIYADSANDFTVTNCIVRNNFAERRGGGIYWSAPSGTTAANAPTFDNVRIGAAAAPNLVTDGTGGVKGLGGGMYASGGFLNLSDGVIFDSNEAYNGGGLYASGVNFNMVDVRFMNNVAANDGGGLYGSGISGTIELSDPYVYYGFPIFDSNTAANSGGGAYVTGSVDIRDITFDSNTATVSGGGVYGAADFIRCDFTNNIAATGGGMYFSGYNDIYNCVFDSNIATTSGGGIYAASSSTSKVVNTLIVDNNAVTSGGGIYVDDDGGLDLINSTVVSNIAGTGDGLYIDNAAGGSAPSVNITNSIVYVNGANTLADNIGVSDAAGDTIGLANSIVGGLPADPSTVAWINDGLGNFDSNPRFALDLNPDINDAAGPDGIYRTLDDGYRLFAGSPAFDMGDNDALPFTSYLSEKDENGNRPFVELPVDLTGEQRVRDNVVDIGAYEKLILAYVDSNVDYLAPNYLGDGTSWNSAFRFLQDALEYAALPLTDIDEIWVAGGTSPSDPAVYSPTLDNAGSVEDVNARKNPVNDPTNDLDRFLSFNLVEGVLMYGGWDTVTSDRSLRDSNRNPTVLTGDLKGDDDEDWNNITDNSFHVVSAIGDGRVIQDISESDEVQEELNDNGYAVAVDDSGRILVAGSYDNGNGDKDIFVARYLANGQIDTTFAVHELLDESGNPVKDDSGSVIYISGYNTFDIDGGDDEAFDIAIQDDGKIVIAGTATNVEEAPLVTTTDAVVLRLLSDGSKDTSFSGDGVGKYYFTAGMVANDGAGGNGFNESISSVVIQSDGKIAIAGAIDSGAGIDSIAFRLNVDGSLDNTFDGDGGWFSGYATDDGFSDVAVQRVETAANVWEERLVFSGYYTFGVGDRDGLIVRLDSLGNFDASLAGGGGWISGDGNDDIFNTLAVEDNSLASATDGRITLGGFIDNGVWVAPDWVADRDILLARVNFDGSMDTSFDGDSGTANGWIVNPLNRGGNGFNNEAITQLTITDSGDIYAGGYVQSSASNYSYNFFSAKYSSTGVSDNTYGTGGVSETDIIANRKSLDTSLDMAEGMALDNLGRVILVGSTVNATSEGQANWDEDAGDWTSDIAIVRHDTSGQEDIWFNFDGILTKSLPTPDAELIDTPVNDYGSDVVVQDDGKVITVGHFDTTDLHTDIIVTRMERDGRLDSTFGTDGELRFRLSDNNDYATAVALQDDGKILVTGYTVYGDVENDSVADTDIFVARFNSDGSVDTSFGDDLDGNGSKDGYKIIAFDRGGNDRDIANDILVQDDGKIVVAGSIEGSDDSINIDTDAVFIRLTADGQLDTDFQDTTDDSVSNGTGYYIWDGADANSNEAINAITLEGNGHILAAGYGDSAGFRQSVLMRFDISDPDKDGNVTFTYTDADGNPAVDPINGNGPSFKYIDASGAGRDSQLNGIIMQSDGKILAVGQVDNGADTDFMAMRLLSTDGSLDNTFGGTGGIITTDFNSDDDSAYDVAIHNVLVDSGVYDERIVIAGQSKTGFAQMGGALAPDDVDFAIARYKFDGTLDTSWDDDGKVTSNFNYAPDGKSPDLAYAIAVDIDENIIVAGTVENFQVFATEVEYDRSIGISRYHWRDGSYDSSWDDAEKEGVRFDGFTVVGGNAGAKAGSNVILPVGDEYLQDGGGIYIDYSSNFVLANSNIIGNMGTHGGGIFINDKAPDHDLLNAVIKDIKVIGNRASFSGGGLAIPGGSVYIVSSVFSGNDGGGWGGAISNYSDNSGYLRIDNSAFVGNTAATGGAFELNRVVYDEIYPSNVYYDVDGMDEADNWFPFALEMESCTISGNEADVAGAIYNHPGVTARVMNTLIWENYSQSVETNNFNADGTFYFTEDDFEWTYLDHHLYSSTDQVAYFMTNTAIDGGLPDWATIYDNQESDVDVHDNILDSESRDENGNLVLDDPMVVGWVVNGKWTQDADVIADVLVQDDGKVIVVGYIERADGGSDVMLARYNIDGTPDATFGDDPDTEDVDGPGYVVYDIGGELSHDSGTVYDVTHYAAFDGEFFETAANSVSDTGTSLDAGMDWGYGESKVVTQATVYASVDHGFDRGNTGTERITVTLEGTNDAPDGSPSWRTLGTASAVVDQAGRIVTVGSGSLDGYRAHRVVITTDNDDKDDPTTLYIGEVQFTETTGETIRAAALQDDGKIVLVGEQDDDFLTMRFNDDGTLDTVRFNETVSADIDGDGDDDFVAISSVDDTVVYYENATGDGKSWISHTISTGRDNPSALDVGDIDGDGDLDVVVASKFDDTIAWYENGNSWTEHIVDNDAGNVSSIAIGNIQGDGGGLDIAVGHEDDGEVVWYWNSLEDGTLFSTGSNRELDAGTVSISDVELADADGDGDVDIFFSSFDNDTIGWFQSDGTANSDKMSAAPLIILDANSANVPDGVIDIELGDLDGDADLDLIYAAHNIDTIGWLEYDGSAGDMFTDVPTVITAAIDGVRSIALADIDGDGDNEIAYATNKSGRVGWYESNGTLGDIVYGVTGAWTVSTGDFDNDGDVDLIHGVTSDQLIHWYANRTGVGDDWTSRVIRSTEHGFGPDGKGYVLTDIANNSADTASSIVIHNNKILVGGWADIGQVMDYPNANGPDGIANNADDPNTFNKDSDFAMVRYLQDGTLDSSFQGVMESWRPKYWSLDGTDFAPTPGIVTTDIGARDSDSIEVNHDYMFDLAISDLSASGGPVRIIAIGDSWTGDWDEDYGRNYDFAITAYDWSDGAIDTSFGDNGKVLVDFGGDDWTNDIARSVEVRNDGVIFVAGTNGQDMAVVALNTDGTRYGAFGGGAHVTAEALSTTDEYRQEFGARFGENPAQAFGTGMVTIDIGTTWGGALSLDEATDIVLDSSGRVVLAGNNLESMVVVRLNSNGDLDTSFNGDGIATVSAGNGNDEARGLVLQDTGGGNIHYTIAGSYKNDVHEHFALARFDMNGQLDATFDGASGSGNGVITDFIEAAESAVYDSSSGLTTIYLSPNETMYQTGKDEKGFFNFMDERWTPFSLNYPGKDGNPPRDARKWNQDEFKGFFIRPDAGSFLDDKDVSSEYRQYYIVGNSSMDEFGRVSITVMGDVTAMAEKGNTFRIVDYHLIEGSAALDAGRHNKMSSGFIDNQVMESDIGDIDDDDILNEDISTDVYGDRRLEEFTGENSGKIIMDIGAWEGAHTRGWRYIPNSEDQKPENPGRDRDGRTPIDISINDADGNELTTIWVDENLDGQYYYSFNDDRATIGYISGVDPDGDELKFSLADNLNYTDYAGKDLFNVSSWDGSQGEWRLEVESQNGDWHSLDYEYRDSYTITICATDSEGNNYYEDFEIKIRNDRVGGDAGYASYIADGDGYEYYPNDVILADEDGNYLVYLEDPDTGELYITVDEESYMQPISRMFGYDEDWYNTYDGERVYNDHLMSMISPYTGIRGSDGQSMFDYTSVYIEDAFYVRFTVAQDMALNYEEQRDYTVTMYAWDAEGRRYAEDVNIHASDTNDDPTDVLVGGTKLSTAGPWEVDENDPRDSGNEIVFGELTAEDEDLLSDKPWLEEGRDDHKFDFRLGSGGFSTYTTVNGERITTSSDGNFEIIETGGEYGTYTLRMAADAVLDFEDQDTYSVWIRTTDTEGRSNVREFVVSADDTNDAPVLTPQGSDLTAINEDEVNNPGDTVTDLIGSSLDDQDVGAKTGIAIYKFNVPYEDLASPPAGRTSGSGTWQYWVDGTGGANGYTVAANWVNVNLSVYDGTKALVLAGNDRVRFMPDAENGCTASIEYYGWDQSATDWDGSNWVDSSNNGDTVSLYQYGANDYDSLPSNTQKRAWLRSPFSHESDVADIVVVDVDDEPAALPSSVTAHEDTAYTFSWADFKGDDVDLYDSVENIRITALNVTNGTLFYNAAAVNLGGGPLVIAKADISKLTYQPGNDRNGLNEYNFTYEIYSQNTTSGAGSWSAANTNPALRSAAMTVNVEAANDAPVLNPAGLGGITVITEDQIGNAGDLVSTLLGAGLTETHGDTNTAPESTLEGIAVYGLTDNGHGAWQYHNGNTWVDMPTVSNGNALLLKATDRVRYNPDGERGGNASISFVGWDQSTGNAYATVALPDVTTRTAPVVFNDEYAFSYATGSLNLAVTDVNDLPGGDDIIISRNWVNENTAGVTNVATISYTGGTDVDGDVVNAFRLASDPSGVFDSLGDLLRVAVAQVVNPAATNYVVTFQASDDGGVTWGAASGNVAVYVNHAPTGADISSQSVVENSSGATIGTLSPNDPDSSVGFDTYTYEFNTGSGWTTNNGTYEIAGDTFKLVNGVSLDADETESFTVQFRVSDVGGQLVNTSDITITVEDNGNWEPDYETPTAPAIQAPTDGVDTSYTFGGGDIGIDPLTTEGSVLSLGIYEPTWVQGLVDLTSEPGENADPLGAATELVVNGQIGEGFDRTMSELQDAFNSYEGLLPDPVISSIYQGISDAMQESSSLVSTAAASINEISELPQESYGLLGNYVRSVTAGVLNVRQNVNSMRSASFGLLDGIGDEEGDAEYVELRRKRLEFANLKLQKAITPLDVAIKIIRDHTTDGKVDMQAAEAALEAALNETEGANAEGNEGNANGAGEGEQPQPRGDANGQGEGAPAPEVEAAPVM